jgi:EthD domain
LIKIIYCIARKPHLTREQFQDYWLNHHGKLVWSRAKSIGMVRYAQSHTTHSALGAACAAARGGGEPYDGVMEGWWESDEAAMAAFGSDAGRASMELLFADEGTFMDFDRCRIFTARELIWE